MRGLFFGLMVICLPMNALGAYESGTIISVEEELRENYYGAGEVVHIKAPVDGDVFVVGRDVTIDAPVSGDILVFAQNVEINAVVGGDVRGAGESVSVGAHMGGEVLLAGHDVVFLSESHITKDAYVAAEEASFNGVIAGDMKFAGQHARFGDDAKAENALYFYGVSQEDVVGGSEELRTKLEYRTSHAESGHTNNNFSIGSVLPSFFVIAVMSVLYAFVAFMILKKSMASLVPSSKNHFLICLLSGFAALLVTPFVAMVFLVTGLGSLLGGIVFLLYLLMILVALPITAIVCGSYAVQGYRRFIEKRLGDGLFEVTATTSAIGGVIVAVMIFIPVIGPVTLFVIFVAVCGALVMHLWRSVRS